MATSNGHTPSELINSEILATCSALGYFEDGVYHKEPDCIECLKDLIRFLRNDKEQHEVRRHLGAVNVLQTDLLPILCQFTDDDMIFDATLRLLVNLTNPALLLYQEELPEDKKTRNFYLELVSALQKYKIAFADSKVWDALKTRLQSLLEKEPDNHDEEDTLIMERILILIRNVVVISSGPADEMRTDDDVSAHDQVIWAMNVSGMADLLVYIAGNEDEQQFCFHVIEIISQMLREQTPSQLASAGTARNIADKQKDIDELTRIRTREQAVKAKSAKNFPRYPRFGVTYQVKDFTSISDRDVICHKIPSNSDKVDLNANKQKRNTPKNLRPMSDVECNRRSTLSIRRFLRDFCTDFLDNAYNTFMAVLKDHLTRGHAQDHDETYYLWAINFFMEVNRLHNFDVSRISETLSIPMFHYIHTQLDHYQEMMAADKKKMQRWSRRLHLGLKAYHEIFMTLSAMDTHADRNIKESAKVIKGNIFYTSEYRDLLRTLLCSYDPVKYPKSYLKDLVETVHVFVRMLEQYCKVHTHVIVQKKDKKRKKKTKKSKSGESKISPEEQLQKLWDEITDDVTNALQVTEPVERVSPFDPTLELSEDEQKSAALVKIQSALREKRTGESVALLRASRELWPEGDLFGKSGINHEEEFLSLREMFFTKLEGAPEFPPKEPVDETDDDEDSDSQDEEELSTVRISEQEFNFKDFIRGFANPKIVKPYAYLLTDYQKNSDFTNKALLKMMHRIAWDCKMYGMFFQASIFQTFQKILDDPTRQTHSLVKELSRFAVFVVGKFFEVSKKNPKVFMEFLFWKGSKEVYEIQEGYGNYEKEGSKNSWSEEQDAELQVLVQEYENLGDTDKDLIDYIADNLIDSSKTHRQILRRLKVLDILKKRKPKATSTRPPKEWSEAEEVQLRALFEEYKTSTDILTRILENLTIVRSKTRLVDKLLELGLVSDRKELRKKRSKKGKSSKKERTKKNKDSSASREGFEGLEGILASNSESANSDGSDVSSEEESSGDGQDDRVVSKTTSSKKKKKKTKRNQTPSKVSLDLSKLSEIFKAVLEADLNPAIVWLKLSLENAIEDLEEEEEGGEDGETIPLVPIVDAHNKAMKDDQFCQLLLALQLTPPDNQQERFWRIPSHLTVDQLRARVQVIERAERGQLWPDINTVETNDQSAASFREQMTTNDPNDESSPDTKSRSEEVTKKRKKILLSSDSGDNAPTYAEKLERPKLKRKKIIVDSSSDSEKENDQLVIDLDRSPTKNALAFSKTILSSDSEPENLTPSVEENMISRGKVALSGDNDVNDDKAVTSEEARGLDDASDNSLGLRRKRKERALDSAPDTTIDVVSDADDHKSVTRPRKIRLIQSDEDE